MSDADEDALRRDLVEETLHECERLLAAAQLDATEIRETAQRHAQERAAGTARALTAAAERLREEAATDRNAAREALDRARAQFEEAQRLREQMDAELRSATAAREEVVALLADVHQDSQRLTGLAEARLADAAALQAELQAERVAQVASHDPAAEGLAAERLATERLQRLEAEAATRVEEAERAAAERLADAEAAARRMATDLLADAERQASRQLADASAAAGALLAEAQQKAATLGPGASEEADKLGAGEAERRAEPDAAKRVADAERTAAKRLAEADDEATRQLLDALEQARVIVKGAEAEAAQIRTRAETRAGPAANDRKDHQHDEGDAGSPVDDPPDTSVGGQRRRARRQRKHLRVLGLVVGVLATSVLMRSSVAESYTVALTSMEPELSDGDRVLLNKLAYQLAEPARGDVVVFDTDDVPGAADAPISTLVKRVIGLPGEVVQGLDDRVVVDGEVIDDPWHGAPTPAFGPILVPEEMLFVLGDNRALSVDSRTFGVVPIDAITGRVEAVIWPPDRAGRV